MEKFFLGKDLARAKRMARLLNKLTGKTVYIEEDFGSLPPIHRANLYCVFGEKSI